MRSIVPICLRRPFLFAIATACSIAGAGETGGVAYMAHIGGFAAGCLLTLLLRGRTATA